MIYEAYEKDIRIGLIRAVSLKAAWAKMRRKYGWSSRQPYHYAINEQSPHSPQIGPML